MIQAASEPTEHSKQSAAHSIVLSQCNSGVFDYMRADKLLAVGIAVGNAEAGSIQPRTQLLAGVVKDLIHVIKRLNFRDDPRLVKIGIFLDTQSSHSGTWGGLF